MTKIYLPKLMLYLEGSVADPAHLIWASTVPPHTKGALPIVFTGTRWQRFLIQLLASSFRRTLERSQEEFPPSCRLC